MRILNLISLFRISFYQFQGKENSLGKSKRTLLKFALLYQSLLQNTTTLFKILSQLTLYLASTRN